MPIWIFPVGGGAGGGDGLGIYSVNIPDTGDLSFGRISEMQTYLIEFSRQWPRPALRIVIPTSGNLENFTLRLNTNTYNNPATYGVFIDGVFAITLTRQPGETGVFTSPAVFPVTKGQEISWGVDSTTVTGGVVQGSMSVQLK